jgi:hypothetical protein
MSNMTVADDIAEIEASAADKRTSAFQKAGTVSPGDVIRQGDLYLVCLGDKMPKFRDKPEVLKDQQLAPGTSQGSRHVAVGAVHYKVNTDALADLMNKATGGKTEFPGGLCGGMIKAGKECVIEHPEHGHIGLPEGDYWGIGYQRQYAEELRRVQD